MDLIILLLLFFSVDLVAFITLGVVEAGLFNILSALFAVFEFSALWPTTFHRFSLAAGDMKVVRPVRCMLRAPTN